MLNEMDIVALFAAAEKESSKAAEAQVKNWIKGLIVDCANLELKARRLREEADAVDAKRAEKVAQLDRVKSGDATAIQIDEFREGKGGKDDKSNG